MAPVVLIKRANKKARRFIVEDKPHENDGRTGMKRIKKITEDNR